MPYKLVTWKHEAPAEQGIPLTRALQAGAHAMLQFLSGLT